MSHRWGPHCTSGMLLPVQATSQKATFHSYESHLPYNGEHKSGATAVTTPLPVAAGSNIDALLPQPADDDTIAKGVAPYMASSAPVETSKSSAAITPRHSSSSKKEHKSPVQRARNVILGTLPFFMIEISASLVDALYSTSDRLGALCACWIGSAMYSYYSEVILLVFVITFNGLTLRRWSVPVVMTGLIVMFTIAVTLVTVMAVKTNMAIMGGQCSQPILVDFAVFLVVVFCIGAIFLFLLIVGAVVALATMKCLKRKKSSAAASTNAATTSPPAQSTA